MRIAIVSDVHSNFQALSVVKGHIDEAAVDLVVCAGDTVGYGANPNECCDTIRQLARCVTTGNHDIASLTRSTEGMNPYAAEAAEWTGDNLDDPSREFLQSLKESATLQTDDRTCAMYHGSIRSVWEYLYEEDVRDDLLRNTGADVLIFGHTHIPYIKKFPSGLIVNPGSVGQPRDGDPRASLAILDTRDLRCDIVRLQYDIRAAAQAIREAGLPDFLATRLLRGR